MPPITLENQYLQTSIDPDHGTSLRSFSTRMDDRWLPLMPDVEDPHTQVDCASFLMVPYSNRIEDGRFTFAGQTHQLDNAANHAIHGDVRQRPWIVEERSDTHLCCTFDSADHHQINWPWPFAARAEYSLRKAEFTSRLTLWNRAADPMPAGFGWHPYFNRRLTADGEPVHLRFNVASAYPDANDNRIPSGPAQALQTHQDFTAEKALDPNNFLDTCFHGYNGNGHIIWPRSGVELFFTCSSPCTHLVVYNPATSHFAVEPVTNANNGVNLLAQGDRTSGVVQLAPDESLDAHFSLRVDFTD
jgi:aldose 1-epimerase